MYIVETHKAPAAIGPYSQAVVVEHLQLVFTAGQLGLLPESGEFAGSDIKSQAHQCLQNIRAILKAAGSDLHNVIKTTIFLQDMTDFGIVNQVYAQYFADSPPARSAVEVSRLPKGALIEIEAVATLEK